MPQTPPAAVPRMTLAVTILAVHVANYPVQRIRPGRSAAQRNPRLAVRARPLVARAAYRVVGDSRAAGGGRPRLRPDPLAGGRDRRTGEPNTADHELG